MQAVEKLLVESVYFEGQILELMGINHASYPIMLGDELVAASHLFACGVFWWIESIFDHFEHYIEGDKSEDRQHHSRGTTCPNDFVMRILHVPIKGSVEICFPMLVEAN